MPTKTLLRVNQFLEKHPAFTHGQIRWLIFNAASNGLERALVRIGRRVLIDIEVFELWLEERRGGA